ncbi:MAG TPA: hypothetical protein VE397_03360 [Stellaceae bacterium]|jgi:hypothetical protein|nr:hypothetical protein [Stellaceae bacterium]
MRALKVLVVVMGILLVGGTAALVVAVIERAQQRMAAPAPPAPSAERGFDRVLDLPPGARVIAVEPAGDRLVVRVALAGGGEALILIDARTGARLGTVELKPNPAGASSP